ncbi:MAG: BON domain-containing protein [Acidobacteria bacterium]|nr:BON domain-containing protein [Acidobacteriota bacterium]
MIETTPPTVDEVVARGATGAVRTVVQDGVAVLVGTVPDVRSWALARDAAVVHPGAVVADLTVLDGVRPRVHPERSIEVARAVQSAVVRAAIDASVLVSCDGGIATLWGCSPTRQDKDVVTIAAWGVPGVGYVQNWIREDC